MFLRWKKKIIERFNKNEVNENQLIFKGKSSRAEHIDSYNKIDIALDTFPVSGGTVSFEASYMGVPILTKINKNSFSFRSGESINKNLNMNDWIVRDENDYIQKAIKFSENKNYLANLKIDLRNFAHKSSLFDAKNFSDDFYKMLLDIKAWLVAGVGFEPTTFRLWAWRATRLLHPAINLFSMI